MNSQPCSSPWMNFSPGLSSTHSREENKQVRVLGSDTTTWEPEEGSLEQPHLYLSDLLGLQLHSCPKNTGIS